MSKFDGKPAWTWPPVFQALADLGQVARDEMEAVMNLGVGMILVIHPENEHEVLAALRAAGEMPFALGTIEAGARKVEMSN